MRNPFPKSREHALHVQLIKVGSLHRRQIGKAFEKVNLSHGQPKILDFLIDNDGCIQREIAKHCFIEPASVTNSLAIMEKGGLIERRQNPDDRRVLNVFLTEKGKEKQKQIGDVFSATDQVALEGFTKDEEEQLINYLERLATNMRRKEE